MTFKDQVKAEEPVFVNPNEFATTADFSGVLINGIFDPGIEGEREPRSPAFLCRDDDLLAINHGDPVTILTVNYWIEGYQPDGEGMATLVLRKI